MTLKGDGTPTNKIFKVFDTTGQRSYTGIALRCFRTREECVEDYKKQVKVAKIGLVAYADRIIDIVAELDKELHRY